MPNATQIISEIENGDPGAAELLLPLVYDELRKLAASRLAQEKPGQTLQATALVHDAYIRMVDVEKIRQWDSRGHFFAAAAESMRRILIERARAKGALKRGPSARRIDFEQLSLAVNDPSDKLIDLDHALSELECHDSQAAQLVKLRFFAGLPHQQAAEALGITRRSADRLWLLAKAWLYQRLGQE